MDHDIRGVAFRVSGIRAPIKGSRVANGAELLRDATWSQLKGLIGAEVPGLGVVLDVGARRVEVVPVGSIVNLVTAEG